MSEMGELYGALREEKKQLKAERLPVRSAEITALAAEGFEVKRITDYQFRITHPEKRGVLDLFPTHNRYHCIRFNKRGGYRDAGQFVNGYFNKQQK